MGYIKIICDLKNASLVHNSVNTIFSILAGFVAVDQVNKKYYKHISKLNRRVCCGRSSKQEIL